MSKLLENKATDDGFDALFEHNEEGVERTESQWVVLKVPKRKGLLNETVSGSSEFITWSDGSKSLCINCKIYDIIESQDKRDNYGLVDSTTAMIFLGFKCNKAILRPALNAISRKDLQDEKKSRIVMAQSGVAKSSSIKGESRKDKQKGRSKIYEDGIEDFLEDDSYSD